MKSYKRIMARKLLIIFLASAFFASFALVNTAGAQIKIENPLKYNTIEELIEAIINFLFTLALIVVPLVIVVAGYFFIVSAGDPVKVSKAKNMVIYALVGLLIIATSKGIIAVIDKVIKG